MRTDGHALVPPKAPEVLFDQNIRKRFGVDDNIVVVLRSKGADAIFNAESIQVVRDLTADFERLPGLRPGDVMSLATEPGFRLRPGTYSVQNLLEPPLKSRAELDQLRRDIERIGLYSGSLVSADSQSTAILISVPPTVGRTELYWKVIDIVSLKLRSKMPGVDEIRVTGAPVAEALLGIHILEDLGVPDTLLGVPASARDKAREWNITGLIPLAIAVMMLVLLVSFRNPLAMLVPLPGVLATLAVVFGLMGWLGIPIYLTIAVMPVLLTVTGVINDIYLFSRYFALLRQGKGAGHTDLLFETFDKLVSPLAATSLATAVGFFSFCFSPIGPVRAFGVCSGIGAVIGLLCSVTIVPSLLAVIDPKRFSSKRDALLLRNAFERFGFAVVKRRRVVVGVIILTVAATPFGLRRLVVQDSWTSGFDPDSDFSRATRFVNDNFYGMHLLLVSCDAPQSFQGEISPSNVSPGRVVLPRKAIPDGMYLKDNSLSIFSAGADLPVPAPWHTFIEKIVPHGDSVTVYTPRLSSDIETCRELSKSSRLRFEIAGQRQFDPSTIHAMDQLGQFIRSLTQYGVGGVLGPGDYLRTTRFLMRPDDPAAKTLPATAPEAAQLWDYYRVARGEQRLRQVVDSGYTQSLTTVFLKHANYVDTANLIGAIRAYEREHLAPVGIRVGFAGDVALSQTLIHAIVTTQLHSLVWSLLGIFAVTAWFGGSWRWGFYCLLPSLLAVIIKFAIMGWLGIPLGVATSMFAAMTLGLGVNCAIHLMEAERQLRIDGAPLAEALPRALALSGPPACINTLALCLGFGILIFSKVPANARLGLLLSLGLAICFLVSMILLPIWLRWKPPSSVRGPNH